MNPTEDISQVKTEILKELGDIKAVLWNQSLRIEEKVERIENVVNSNTVELRQEVERLESRMDKKQELYLKISRIDTNATVTKAVERLEKTMLRVKDDLITRIDPLLQELENRRENRVLLSDHFNKLEKRVDKLEEIQRIAHD